MKLLLNTHCSNEYAEGCDLAFLTPCRVRYAICARSRSLDAAFTIVFAERKADKHMSIGILHRWTRAVVYTSETAQNIGEAAMEARAKGAFLSGADLRGAFLRGADLRGADLRDAFLRGAVLRDADLSDADLRDADLRDADLRGADLRGADLRGADLRGADLRGAVLRGAVLSDAEKIQHSMQIIGVAEWGTMTVLKTSCGVRIIIGCQNFLLPEARAHWKDRADRPRTRMCLDWAEAWAAAIA